MCLIRGLGIGVNCSLIMSSQVYLKVCKGLGYLNGWSIRFFPYMDVLLWIAKFVLRGGLLF